MDFKMNERIKELAIQAGFFYEDYKDIWYLEYHNQTCEEEMKKFAELIVEECMEQVWYSREDGINGNISQVIKDRIKEHFGVE
jgi:hypothetical protein